MKRLFAILVLAGCLGAIWMATMLFMQVSPPQTMVTIKPGTTTRQMAKELESAGVIRSAFAFRALNVLEGRRTLKAGDYLFDRPANALEVYDRLARGDVISVAVVIPEGYNVWEIASALEQAHLCSRDEFLRVARDEAALVTDMDPGAKSLEGYLFPDTYHLMHSQSAKDIAATMVQRFRKEATSLGLTGNPELRRLVVLASIVEKETSAPDERALVAGVFENRLSKGIALATDPSVIYAALLAGKYDGVIHQSDLERDSAYNTYRYPGLPPGPIANPGRAALDAAMHPAKTDFLYFVANNHGGHNFSRTLDEHNRNVNAYRTGLSKGRR
ncbi:MAG: endolytic transglycosylase MltG [Acidobacteriales bacterium]|nr:endolytic transglycosylase MltG [Terriglobales bacterium]